MKKNKYRDMEQDESKYEKMKFELFLLLTYEDAKVFRKALNQVLLDWVEHMDLPRDKDRIVYRMHLLIDFFDKIDELEMGK
jgi:hypothetical protein